MIGIIGAALVLVAVLGAVAVGLVASSTQPVVPSRGNAGYATPGRRIFFTGIGRAGPIARTGGFGMMASGGCATCHGADGRGGRIGMMMGRTVEVPDIRYLTLTSPKTGNGKTEPGWTDAEIAAAIRDGKDPAGGSLSSYMPRWQMDDTDVNDLIAYLKELK
jgi:cytochrome c oxidase subunit 2